MSATCIRCACFRGCVFISWLCPRATTAKRPVLPTCIPKKPRNCLPSAITSGPVDLAGVTLPPAQRPAKKLPLATDGKFDAALGKIFFLSQPQHQQGRRGAVGPIAPG